MYLQNKYTKWYFSIISTAKSRISNDYQYYEIHHILPKSLGGSNQDENLIKLTPKEHFICHLLLTKMTTGKDKRNMNFAFWSMANKRTHTNSTETHNFNINSRSYQIARKNFSIENSITHKGKVLSQETKDKISASHKGKKLSDEHKSKINPAGRILSQETKDKISQGQKGRIGGMTGKSHTAETKSKISNSNKGKTKPPLSLERKHQISEQFSGTKQSDEHKSKRLKSRQENGYYKNEAETKRKMSVAAMNRPTFKCHCGKECSLLNFKRWHGDNCKLSC